MLLTPSLTSKLRRTASARGQRTSALPPTSSTQPCPSEHCTNSLNSPSHRQHHARLVRACSPLQLPLPLQNSRPSTRRPSLEQNELLKAWEGERRVVKRRIPCPWQKQQKFYRYVFTPLLLLRPSSVFGRFASFGLVASYSHCCITIFSCRPGQPTLPTQLTKSTSKPNPPLRSNSTHFAVESSSLTLAPLPPKPLYSSSLLPELPPRQREQQEPT